MNDSEIYQAHLGALLSHLRYNFTIHDISSVFIDGNFSEVGFCVKIDNEIQSRSVSEVVELHFDHRGYMISFKFNVLHKTFAICLDYDEKFTVENSHKFIDIVKYFMENIDVRMGNEKDVDLMIERLERGDTCVNIDDEMTASGIHECWKKCLTAKILV